MRQAQFTLLVCAAAALLLLPQCHPCAHQCSGSVWRHLSLTSQCGTCGYSAGRVQLQTATWCACAAAVPLEHQSISSFPPPPLSRLCATYSAQVRRNSAQQAASAEQQKAAAAASTAAAAAVACAAVAAAALLPLAHSHSSVMEERMLSCALAAPCTLR
eukprot:TRINITY_DN29421_c0_g1_i2.p2 TRINITY_DN29421_c0_g1~~TRINITY_DN29421_c0_g1_i2.p2  ORF type:complete len:159 (+),score=36.44 TRINITY_DN29421_c0_g1_i2:426-902(+)